MTQDPGVHGNDGNPADGNPPAAPNYGAPGYGSPAPDYGNPPAAPGYPAPGYRAQQPGYGAAQQPGYPSQPPSYNPPGGYAQPTATAAPLSPAEEKQYAMFAHLGGILGWVGWLPSLIIYMMYKDRGPFVKDQATTALNFQITAAIGFFALTVLDVMLPLPIFLLNFALYVAVVVFSVIGGIAANRGQAYRYPFSLSLVK